MSVRSGLFTQVSSQLSFAGIISDATKFYEGTPEPLPLGEAPIAVMWLEEPDIQDLTMGTTGKVGETYNMVVRIYLGAEDMPEADAQAAAPSYADMLRYAFYVPTDLGSTTIEQQFGVFNTEHLGGTNNIRTYRQSGEPPYLEYTLQITEHRARNASAS